MTERPWLAHYPKSVQWDQSFPAKPLYRLLDETADAHPDWPYLDFMGKRQSYGAVKAKVERAAAGLQRIGVTKGTKVGLFLPNCPQFIIGYYAILKAGGTVVNFSPLYSIPELLHQVEDSETDIMITLDVKQLFEPMSHVREQSRLQTVVVGSIGEALPRVKGLQYGIAKRRERAALPRHDSFLTFQELMDNDGVPEPVEIDPHEDVAVLQYTGGTTGTPKGAMLTHANLSINAQQTLAWDQDFQPQGEKMLGALPLFHVFAMTLVMNVTTLAGGEIVLMPKFELDEALDLVSRRKITLMPGVPTMFNAILHHKQLGKYDLSSLRMCFSGGAPLPAEVKKGFEKVVPGVAINEGYGLTETSPVASSNPQEGAKIGSIGVPVPGTEIVILDRDNPGQILGLGQTGEIGIRGPQVMKGYYRRPEATAEVMCGTILRTGDVGYMDEDGFTFLIDRDKDLILVGGFNVFPRRVEEAVYEHPAVQECTVIGIPHDYLGEAPKAFVVRKTNQSLSEADLLEFLRARIGKHEMPRQIEFRDSLPKTMIGKLSKKELVAEEKAKYEARRAQAQNEAETA